MDLRHFVAGFWLFGNQRRNAAHNRVAARAGSALEPVIFHAQIAATDGACQFRKYARIEWGRQAWVGGHWAGN